MWDWVRWVGDQIWGAVASVIRTLENFLNFVRESFANLFLFFWGWVCWWYALLWDLLKTIVKTVWDFGAWLFEKAASAFFGEDGILVWWIDSVIYTLLWAIDKLPHNGFPPIALNAWNTVRGYVKTIDLVLPVTEFFIILYFLFTVWATVIVMKRILRWIPFAGSKGR